MWHFFSFAIATGAGKFLLELQNCNCQYDSLYDSYFERVTLNPPPGTPTPHTRHAGPERDQRGPRVDLGRRQLAERAADGGRQAFLFF